MSRPRTGFSLIEVIVVMTVLAATLSIVSLSLYQATMFQRDVQGIMQDEATLSRLARVFRADAHRAISVDDDKENGVQGQSELRLTMDDQSVVTYRAIGAQCERTVTKDGQWKHRDVFHGSPQVAFALKLLHGENGRRLSIRITRDPLVSNSRSPERNPDQPAQPQPWINIEAAVPLSPLSKESSL